MSSSRKLGGKKVDFVRQQEDLITFMEASINSELLALVQQAYSLNDDLESSGFSEISYEGTADA